MLFNEYLLESLSIDEKFNKLQVFHKEYSEKIYEKYNKNISTIDIKIIQESGNDEDYLFLKEAAETDSKDSYIKILERIKSDIDNFIKEKNKKIELFYDSEKVKSILEKIEEAKKENKDLFDKKVSIPELSSIRIIFDNFRRNLNKIKAKIKVNITSVDEITKEIGGLEKELKNYTSTDILTKEDFLYNINALVNVNKKFLYEYQVDLNYKEEDIKDKEVLYIKAIMSVVNFEVKLIKEEFLRVEKCLNETFSILKKEFSKKDKTIEKEEIKKEGYDDIDINYESYLDDVFEESEKTDILSLYENL